MASEIAKIYARDYLKRRGDADAEDEAALATRIDAAIVEARASYDAITENIINELRAERNSLAWELRVRHEPREEPPHEPGCGCFECRQGGAV